jgi:hypothetical protein
VILIPTFRALAKMASRSIRLSRTELPGFNVARIAAVEFIFRLGLGDGSGIPEVTSPSGESSKFRSILGSIPL